MQERIVYRTHYQVYEPRLFGLLVRECSSATGSAYADSVALCLSRAAAQFEKRLNVPAAKYAVDNARHLDLLTDNLFWSWRGHVLELVIPQPFALRGRLDLAERLVFLKYYLESDGAVLLALLRRLADGPISWKAFLDTDVMDSIFQEAWSEYLDILVNVRERTRIRQRLEALRGAPLEPKTRKHKATFHLEALVACGAATRASESGGDVFAATDLGVVLGSQLPGVQALETAVDKSGLWTVIADAVHHELPRSEVLPGQRFWPAVVDGYRGIMSSGVSICSMFALIDYATARSLEAGDELPARLNVLEALERERARHPNQVRFHVDRQGAPAYILIEDGLLEELARTRLALAEN